MTEAEWQECDDLWAMLSAARARASDRKLRLLAVTCAAPLLENVRIPEVPLAEMVRTAELFAEGDIDASELWPMYPDHFGRAGMFTMPNYTSLDSFGRWTCDAVALLGWSPNEERPWGQEFAADRSMMVPRPWLPGDYALHRAHRAVTCAANTWTLFASGYPFHMSPWPGAYQDHKDYLERCNRLQKVRDAWVADMCRDIFGNPFRPVAVEPHWLAWNYGTIPAIARRIYEERTYHDMPILADALEDAGCADPRILEHCRCGVLHVRGCWVVDLILGKG
jgi:hypothetical protein